MSEELKAAQARIACLEGEIAKRDARIVELEEQRDRFMASIERKLKLMDEDAAEIDKLRDELVALKDAATTVLDGLNERIAYSVEQRQTTPVFEGIAALHSAIYAAPVSEAKAHGVVQWPEADETMQMAFEEGQPADDASGYCFELEEFDLFIERLMSEVARLNAAPAAPVADAGLVEAFCKVEQALDLIGGIRRGKNVTQDELWQSCELLDAALAAHRAKGVV